jgi:hypothetical protein
MHRYNVRDLLGHWVRPRSRQGAMCPHACCRNKRVHPANMPVILPNRLLRRASEDDLAAHYQNVSRGDSAEQEAARYQVLAEMERRDEAAERRRQAAARHRAILFNRRLEREEAVELAFQQAERDTNGYMLNRRGQALGISDRSLLTGSEARARKYASEELLEHWRTHPRPTEAMFRGEDTRVYEQYTARRPAHPLSRRSRTTATIRPAQPRIPRRAA